MVAQINSTFKKIYQLIFLLSKEHNVLLFSDLILTFQFQ